MQDEIIKFIIRQIEKKGKLPKDIDLDTFNYIESGYVDSMGLISFVAKIEIKFDIELTEDDLLLDSFRTLGGLANIISDKISKP